jgi:glycine hydroxymethyltransferase
VHQLLVDLAPSRREAWTELGWLNRLGISANAIRLAFDEQAEPGVSGLRFGAAALAGRGFRDAEFQEVGQILVDALSRAQVPESEIVGRVAALTEAHPLYGFLD